MDKIAATASKQRVALIGLGMAVAPHARALRDLSDRVEVINAYSPTPARREAFGRNFDFPLTERLETILEDRSVEAVLILDAAQYPSRSRRPLCGGGQAYPAGKADRDHHGARRSPRRGDGRGRRPARHRVAKPLPSRLPGLEGGAGPGPAWTPCRRFRRHQQLAAAILLRPARTRHTRARRRWRAADPGHSHA